MADPDPDRDSAPEPKPERERPREPLVEELPPRLVAVAYVIALVCLVAPLAVLGAGFAGAVLIRRGRPGSGLGVITTAVLCSVVGVLLLH
jgi:uncharacterized RDD family membrane protein YckC